MRRLPILWLAAGKSTCTRLPTAVAKSAGRSPSDRAGIGEESIPTIEGPLRPRAQRPLCSAHKRIAGAPRTGGATTRGGGELAAEASRIVRPRPWKGASVLCRTVAVVQHAAHALTSSNGSMGLNSPERLNQLVANTLMVTSHGNASRTR